MAKHISNLTVLLFCKTTARWYGVLWCKYRPSFGPPLGKCTGTLMFVSAGLQSAPLPVPAKPLTAPQSELWSCEAGVAEQGHRSTGSDAPCFDERALIFHSFVPNKGGITGRLLSDYK